MKRETRKERMERLNKHEWLMLVHQPYTLSSQCQRVLNKQSKRPETIFRMGEPVPAPTVEQRAQLQYKKWKQNKESMCTLS